MHFDWTHYRAQLLTPSGALLDGLALTVVGHERERAALGLEQDHIVSAYKHSRNHSEWPNRGEQRQQPHSTRNPRLAQRRATLILGMVLGAKKTFLAAAHRGLMSSGTKVEATQNTCRTDKPRARSNSVSLLSLAH